MPVAVERWVSRARWLRWVDAAVTFAIVWSGVASVLDVAAASSALSAAVLVGTASLWRPLRRRWRPASALVSLSVSRGLRAGDLAWCVFPDHVERVIVTARRGWRLVVARPGQGPQEGVEVRRTRVLVVHL